MSEARTVVCAGYMPLDIIDADGSIWQRAGGTSANVAAVLAFLGWEAVLVGRVGDDEAGRRVRRDLQHASVNITHINVEAGALTNRLVHQVRADGHRYLFTCPHCAQRMPRSRPLRLDQVDAVLEAFPQPDVYFFDRANPSTVLLAEQYAAAGVTIVFEPSTPVHAALIERAMSVAAVVKGSAEHGLDLVEQHGIGRSSQVRVITEGIRGARFRLDSGRWSRVGVFDVNVVDAAGAGDWTTAALLDTIVGTPITPAAVKTGITFGHALAALNCALPGARGLMDGRTLDDVASLVRQVEHDGVITPPLLQIPQEPPPRRLCAWCLLELTVDQATRAASG